VSFAGSVAGTRYVVVEHATGLRTTYGRLATIVVAAGSRVSAGSIIGTTADRFFFGVRRGDTYVDPTRYLVQLHRRPRLVPTDGSPRLPDRSAVYSCAARRALR
jgi:murein DD-endopeptidase MepM/ murein hydrolase activator NlpD